MGGGQRWQWRAVTIGKVAAMLGVRVVLIGGTSHAGKSTVGQVVADRVGFEYRSTDRLARHPGRPWRTPDWDVPAHVAEHYSTLTVDELIASVLEHYERLWPRIQELITQYAAGQRAGAGLVLEGSALWPDRVARLTVPHTAAVWLTAEDSVVRARMYEGSRYEEAAAEEQHLIEKFLARTVRYQALMQQAVDSLGLASIDADGGRSPEELADAVLTVVGSQGVIGRSTAGIGYSSAAGAHGGHDSGEISSR